MNYSFLAVVLVVLVATLADGHEIQRRQAANQEFVAFSAGLSHDQNVTHDVKVSYDILWIDTANAFDKTTGTFIAPSHGVYTFIFHGLSQTAGTLWLELFKNSVYQMSAYAFTEHDYAAASNAVTLECAKGDSVYIIGHGSNELFGRMDQIYTSFSGFINIHLP